MNEANRTLIVIPAFNEEESLRATVRELHALPAGYELLIVNDGSLDTTSHIAHELFAVKTLPTHVVDLPVNCGIGAAVQTGYLFAARQGGFRYVVQFDADGQHPAADIERLVGECERRHLDLCIGSRFAGGRPTLESSTFPRRIGIRFLSRLVGWLGKTKITDATSGFRCAGPRAWQAFAESYPDDYPEPESAHWCLRNGLSVGELPVVMFRRQGGRSSIRSPVLYMVKVTLAILVGTIRRKDRFGRLPA